MQRLGSLLPSRSWMRVFCKSVVKNTLIQRRLIPPDKSGVIRLCILLPHGRRKTRRDGDESASVGSATKNGSAGGDPDRNALGLS